MVTTTRTALDGDKPPWRRLAALTRDLRALYRDTYWAAHRHATDAARALELPDGTRLDPSYTADATACRSVNNVLAGLVDYHLPGAALVERVDDAPTVIDSQWLYHDQGEDLDYEITIQWDYRYSFGDPDGLSLRAAKTTTHPSVDGGWS